MAEDREPRWLTYREAARALGMSPESLRARARREHWRKTLGNDGKALVLVPPDTACIPAASREDEPPASRPVVRPHPGRDTALSDLVARLAAAQTELVETSGRLGVAEGTVATLKETLAKSEAMTERERARADETLHALRLAEAEAAYVPALKTTVEVLKSALTAEKERSADLRAERDRLNARRSWWPFRRAG
jgi:hypothetical protein